MKRLTTILIAALLFSMTLKASASEMIPLQFTEAPIDYPQFFLLPNGSYEAIYYVPNNTEYWLNQGRNDVSNCAIEIFDASGKSVWYYPILGIDIFADDPDAFFYQNAVYSDQIVFETYWNHSYEQYVSRNWSLNGERLYTSFDPIRQPEESFRYIVSHYPYTLEMWPFGELHDTPARLTYVVDGTTATLPFAYGVRTSCVDVEERYYMLYEADDSIEGEQGTVYLLSYSPDTHKLACYKTNLATCSGPIAVWNDKLVFLQEKVLSDALIYELYSSSLGDGEQDTLSFSLSGEISLGMNEVIENIIPANDLLLCLKSRIIDMNMDGEYVTSELCTVSPEGELTLVHTREGEARFLGNAAGSLQFVCADGADGYQIIRLTDEDATYFFTYFDQAQ